MPVSAPDGRTVIMEVRDGEQHDLLRFTTVRRCRLNR